MIQSLKITILKKVDMEIEYHVKQEFVIKELLNNLI